MRTISRHPATGHLRPIAAPILLAAAGPACAAGQADVLAGAAGWLISLALLALVSAFLLLRLRARKDQAIAALNALPVAVVQLDAAGALIFVNPAGAALLGLSAEGEGPAWRLLDHASREPLLAGLLYRARRDGTARLPAGTRLVNGYGLELEVEGSCQSLSDTGGKLSSFLLQLRDVSEEREWRRQQPDLWDREPVSNLPGRGTIEKRLNLALLNRRASDVPMTYLHIRLGGIVAVYTSAGEAAGDALVRHLSALLRAQVRETDLIARQGEEDFAVLLTLCPAEVSRRIAAKIMARLTDFRFEWDGRSYAIHAGMGEIDIPPFEGSLDELLAAAQPKA